MSASEHLNHNQFVGHAVNELALNHPAWEGDPQPLQHTEEHVHPSSVRFQRYPASDPRVATAMSGYINGDNVPPVRLVRRAGETMTADGHHRLSAAEHVGVSLDAVVAHSPRSDKYWGKANIGEIR